MQSTGSFHMTVKLSQSELLQQQPQEQEVPQRHKTLRQADPIWLRDTCSCKLCVDASSKQKRFQTSDIPLDIDFLHKETGSDGSLTVTWSNDIPGFGSDHVSHYAKDSVRPPSHRIQMLKHYRNITPYYWNKDKMEKSTKFFDFSLYMSQDSVVFDVLNQLSIFGLVFLRNVPESEKAVEDIATRIGPLKNTFYGLTWDVKSVPEAKNVAYTHQHLGLHMDLLYMANPPALQLLHCLKNTCKGGTSMFCDSWNAANRLRRHNPDAFNRLLSQQITFEYVNAGQHYHRERYVIRKKDEKPGGIAEVNWSPPFQGPFVPGSDPDFHSYLKALKAFAAMLESKQNIYEYRMEEGECVIFNNQRVLHARTAFDISSGERWLKGAYVDGDAWHSRHMDLGRIFPPFKDRVFQYPFVHASKGHNSAGSTP